MTPVEERIDHPRDRLTAWLDDVQLSNRLGSPVYANPSELKADLRALLTEHSAREEVLRDCLDYFRGFDFERTDGKTSPIIPRLEAALPATEPAQPEEER